MEPCLLIASPQMKDPFFEETVVLLWQHDEDGAIGVVINRPIDRTLDEVLFLPDGTELAAQSRVSWGGPVEMSSATVVTTGAVDDDEGWALPGGLSVTRSQTALDLLLQRQDPVLLCLGYAGWGPGQLDDELEKGGWLYTDLQAALVFPEGTDTVYANALATLGLTRNTVWMNPISE